MKKPAVRKISIHEMKEGDLVAFRKNLDNLLDKVSTPLDARGHLFHIIERGELKLTGMTGRVVDLHCATSIHLGIELNDHHEILDEWDNQLIWTGEEDLGVGEEEVAELEQDGELDKERNTLLQLLAPFLLIFRVEFAD